MHFVLSLIITVLGLWTWTGHAQVASVSLRPLEFIASEGSATIFHCSVTNANALLWRVDTIVLPNSRITERNITGPTTTGENNFQSQITIPATLENDNSSIQCIASTLDGTGSNVLSPVATYRVQGMKSRL